ncbi:hypothetical protein Vadar_014983 [Vaccinium darrowii]|uniref:Uncharacterized protein n=1 Tax=Vaccinium darrowii TaxID=229202 RepID=A0ACB7YEX0_9ERIC|nr:hypothetical protein Vadar_014983 [Vaccinium darrowii]
MAARIEFSNTNPPSNYVAGLGRCATGLTTGSDIGPARAALDLPDRSATTIGGAAPAGVGYGRGKGPGTEEEESKKVYDEIQKLVRQTKNIETARLLLNSVIVTNPKHPLGWIAAARLEELAGEIQAARQLIAKGCEECPKSEDVWIEACRLSSPDEAKALMASCVKEIPKSEKLWMQAAELQEDEVKKSRVLRRGLVHIPDSAMLWKAVVELANEEDARLLLLRAVACCPLHVELWLALARLETYERAKKILNKARLSLPKEPAIWISTAKLEEANGNSAMVEKIIERGIATLLREGVVIDREAWMKEAEAAKRAGSVATSQAIIHKMS